VMFPDNLQSIYLTLPPRMQSFTVVEVDVVVGVVFSSYTTASMSQLSFKPE
jgi:hypothetical protein